MLLSTSVRPKDRLEAGLVFGYRDDKNYWRAVFSDVGESGAVSLIRVHRGKTSVLAKRTVLYPYRR